MVQEDEQRRAEQRRRRVEDNRSAAPLGSAPAPLAGPQSRLNHRPGRFDAMLGGARRAPGSVPRQSLGHHSRRGAVSGMRGRPCGTCGVNVNQLGGR